MTAEGGIRRRCRCKDADGRFLESRCPKLRNRKHGSWQLLMELHPGQSGSRRRFRRLGYATKDDAIAARDRIRELLNLAGSDEDDQDKVSEMLHGLKRREAIPDPEMIRTQLRSGLSLNDKGTVAEWMEVWLAQERGKHAAKTEIGYESHVRLYINPKIGHIRRTRLNHGDLIEMFNAIEDDNEVIEANNADRAANADRRRELWANRSQGPVMTELRRLKAEHAAMPPYRRPVSPVSQKAILRTLRAALNDAIAQQRLTFNPAAHFDMAVTLERPMVWTDERVDQWTTTGLRPGKVLVWQPKHVGIFFDHVAEHDPSYEAMWHLLLKYGPRRGEVAGLPWAETQLAHSQINIIIQRTETNGYEEKAPKADSRRPVKLDHEDTALLLRHYERQQRRKAELGEAWIDSGKVFTRPDGSPLRPSWIGERFTQHIAAAGLPPIRLHDCRHTAATMLLAIGTDIKVVQRMFGHSTRSTTSDIYTSVLNELLAEAAGSLAALIPRRPGPRRAGQLSGNSASKELVSSGGGDRL